MAGSWNKNFAQQVTKFLVVGIVGTIVNYLVFATLLFVGVSYLLSMPAGFISGTILGYRLNRTWTFNITHSRNFQFVRYLFVYSVSMALGAIFLAFLVEIVGLKPLIANVVTIFLTTTTNFLGIKTFAFKAEN